MTNKSIVTEDQIIGSLGEQDGGTMDACPSHIYHLLPPLLYRSEPWRAASLRHIHRWLLPALLAHNSTEPTMNWSVAEQLRKQLGFWSFGLLLPKSRRPASTPINPQKHSRDPFS